MAVAVMSVPSRTTEVTLSARRSRKVEPSVEEAKVIAAVGEVEVDDVVDVTDQGRALCGLGAGEVG